jgi:pimeloyl-ACP methyl ester carboxylesterase
MILCVVLAHSTLGVEIVGHWKGAIDVGNGIELRLALEIEKSPEGELTATLVSVDQNNFTVTASSLKQDSDSIELKWDRIRATFTGTLAKDGAKMTGQWKQSTPLPITFERLDKPFTLNRPQEPKKPYPYLEEEVSIASAGGIKLAGTLMIPRSAGPHPAVVLITGSGPQDRDEALLGHKPFLVVSDDLTRNGIAVLRCDDRGVGKSGGVFIDAKLADFVNDALACADYLRTRKEIDAKHIGLVGHSEGATIATEAAARSPEKVAFVVMLAGPGVPMVQLLERQTHDLNHAAGIDGELLKRCDEFEKGVLDAAIEPGDRKVVEKKVREAYQRGIAKLTETQRTALGLKDADLERRVSFLFSPAMHELLQYDPQPTLKKVRCPVLALNGEKDLQVAADENLPAIRAAISAGGNTSVATTPLPNLNHLFQHCKTGAPSEYAQIEETFAPEAMKVVSDWIVKQSK